MPSENTRSLGLRYCGQGAVIHEPCIILNPHCIEIGAHSRVDGFCKLEGGDGLTLGKWTHVASYAHLNIGGGTLVAGDGAAFASGCKVISGGDTPAGESMSAVAPPYRRVVVKKTTTVGKNACILTGAIVLGGVTIGDGAVVAAGAVVTKDVPPYEIHAGNPAKKIGERPRKLPQAEATALYAEGLAEYDAVLALVPGMQP